MTAPLVRSAALDELDPRTLYAILALRAEVFVVEQACVYLDPDGRDLEASARHLWIEADGEVLAYLRVLEEPDGCARIGRVCTAAARRGQGLSRQLMQAALAAVEGRDSVLQAQAHLRDWYAGLGYVATGGQYLEDGIPHVDMRRPAPGYSRG
ncbi:MAG: GNAT family N-acetyltransferase [Actinomycetota bacterium]|nr:GNAT family N-acetyltransferase [Actinomycetota bacterium]